MNKKAGIIILIVFFIIVFGLAAFVIILQFGQIKQKINVNLPQIFPPTTPIAQNLTKFTSEEDFNNYINKGRELSESQYYYGRERFAPVPSGIMDQGMSEEPVMAENGGAGRVSETNVQVSGIDEPDIVKTDGKELYASLQSMYYIEPMPMDTVSSEIGIMPPRPVAATKAIKAFPPADLKIDSGIDKQGNLLLIDNTLVIFSYEKIYGYNVADPTKPVELWNVEYQNSSNLEAARLYNGKIYLVLRNYINYQGPCPIRPLIYNGKTLEIACTDIYHPNSEFPVDSTYYAMILDPKTGNIEKTTSFVGGTGITVIYMSKDSIYVTYSYPGDYLKYIYNFYLENKDLVSREILDKLAKLMTYDISTGSKMNELSIILDKYYSALSQDERLKMENEMNNRINDYGKKHSRELAVTGIFKINVSDLGIAANGNVPGTPLNQFSLDEYNGNLRIATTTNSQFMSFGSTGSLSDVYILDANLKQIGSVLNLGLTERIYSVRFIENKGYVVTFRQMDPFYVLDLSNPQNPELKGELKIPGFSSYLHPITKDKILGIGEENNQVKISLFDVSNPSAPTEKAKYNLNEYYTEISSTHHAFLLDDKHQIFFLPGSQGGYIFSYKDDNLKMERAVSNISARRAIYINDYLYIIGDDKIIVINENDWTDVNKIDL